MAVLSWVLGSNSEFRPAALVTMSEPKSGSRQAMPWKPVTILIGPVINGSVLRPSRPSSGTSIASERSSRVGLTGTVPTLPLLLPQRQSLGLHRRAVALVITGVRALNISQAPRRSLHLPGQQLNDTATIVVIAEVIGPFFFQDSEEAISSLDRIEELHLASRRQSADLRYRLPIVVQAFLSVGFLGGR